MPAYPILGCACMHTVLTYRLWCYESMDGNNKRRKATCPTIVDFPAAVETINIVQWNRKVKWSLSSQKSWSIKHAVPCMLNICLSYACERSLSAMLCAFILYACIFDLTWSLSRRCQCLHFNDTNAEFGSDALKWKDMPTGCTVLHLSPPVLLPEHI